MALDDCITFIRDSDSCILKEPSTLPEIPDGLKLPEDLRHFYEQAGGAVLFQGADHSIEIVEPVDFVRANPVIRGEPGEYDVSYNWFIVAQSEPQYISIDLNLGRAGRCYDSFWDRHALRGDCPIISHSFTELLQRLIEGKGPCLFWLADDFVSMGDAYDDVPE